MRRARPLLFAPCSIGLMLASAGCYGPYNSPYGSPYGYPPTGAGAPIQTLQPGGSYTPGAYGQPTLPAFPQESLGKPSGIDQTGGDAPFYNSGSTQPPYDGGGVPTYSDPNEIRFNDGFQQPVQPDHTAVGEYGAVEGASAAVAGVAKVDLDAARFVSPVAVDGTTEEPTFVDAASPPFAHDADYKWLRGVLRFDAEASAWTMIYSDHPSEDDEFAGQLPVADSPVLAPFKPQAVVLLRGEMDDEQSAAMGRAVYRVEVVEPVELSVP